MRRTIEEISSDPDFTAFTPEGALIAMAACARGVRPRAAFEAEGFGVALRCARPHVIDALRHWLDSSKEWWIWAEVAALAAQTAEEVGDGTLAEGIDAVLRAASIPARVEAALKDVARVSHRVCLRPVPDPQDVDILQDAFALRLDLERMQDALQADAVDVALANADHAFERDGSWGALRFLRVPHDLPHDFLPIHGTWWAVPFAR